MKIIEARSTSFEGERVESDGVCNRCGFRTCPVWCADGVVLGGWIGDGVCADVDMFNLTNRRKPDDLVELCQACPVQRQCAEYAIAAKIDHGIWGGLDRSDRRNVWSGRKTLDEVLP